MDIQSPSGPVHAFREYIGSIAPFPVAHVAVRASDAHVKQRGEEVFQSGGVQQGKPLVHFSGLSRDGNSVLEVSRLLHTEMGAT